MDNGKSIIKTFNSLKEKRQTLTNYWSDAFAYTYPNRGMKFINRDSQDGISNANSAQDLQSKIFDTTTSDSVRLLASSVLSGLTPPNSQWANLTVQSAGLNDINYNIRKWLEHSSEIIYKSIHGSNYDSEAFEFILDVVIGGMAGLYIEMDEDNDELVFDHWQLSDMYVVESNQKKIIDTVYREIGYTASQVINIFGEKKTPGFIKELFKEKPDSQEQHIFIHCIKPRKNVKEGEGLLNKSMPFESTYVCKKSGMIVKESGYHEFPVVLPRWQKIPGTHYAVGAVDSVLPDTKTLNKIVQMLLTTGELEIAPPLIAKRDGVLNNNTVQLGPRKVIFAADVGNVKPLPSGSNMNWAAQEIQRLQRQIQKNLMSDQLSPQGNVQMTATEVQVRVKLIRQLLGPVYGRFQSEFLQPLIHRVFGLLIRAGKLGEIPPEIENEDIDIVYTSPLALAQRSEELKQINDFEVMLGNTAQLNQAVLDLYDFDASMEYKSKLLGIPVELLKTETQVKKERKQRTEQEAQQQEMMAAQQAQESQK